MVKRGTTISIKRKLLTSMGFRSLLRPPKKIITEITGHIQNLISALEALHVPRSQRASTKAASYFTSSNDIVTTCSILSLIR